MQPGARIGPFEITVLLGKGGMGEVYRARDSKLGREVAIKILPEAVAADRERLARFEREAQTLAALDHPNVASVYDFRHEDGIHFLVMQLVEGETLADRIARTPYTPRKAVPLFTQIARGLEAAHDRGIVHRDLKPANIKVSDDGDVCVLDFGLAASVGVLDPIFGSPSSPASSPTAQTAPGSPPVARITTDGTIMGTPSYMSPEQARGKPVNKRSDIWSFGCCLYESLTGHCPFGGETHTDTLAAILNFEPDWSLLPEDTPRELRALLRRCLEKEPRRRLSSAGDIAATLEELLTELKRESTPSMRVAPAPQVRRHRFWEPVALCLVPIAAVLAVGYWLWRSPQADTPDHAAVAPIRSLAVLPLDDLSAQRDENYFADGMTEAITAELGKIKSLEVRGRTSAKQYRDTDLQIPEIADALSVDALIEGSVTRDADEVRITVQLVHGATDTHVWTGTYDEELTSVLKLQSDVALAIADAVNAEITGEERARISTARTVKPDAHEAYLLGRYFIDIPTEEGLTTAIRYLEEATRIDPEFADAWVALGEAYAGMTGWTLAVSHEFSPKARDAFRRAADLDPGMGYALAGLADISAYYDYDWETAESRYRRALELSPNSANVHEYYAWFLMILGRGEEAAQHATAALKIEPEDPRLIRNAATVFMNAGQAEAARKNLEQVLKTHPDFIPAMDSLVWAYEILGLHDQAISTAEQYAENVDTVSSLCFLARLLATGGQTERAQSLLQEILQRDDVSQGADLAWIYVSLGQFDEAFAAFERGYERRDWQLMWIRSEPYLSADPKYVRFRNDPRYWALIEKIGFPPLPPYHPGYAEEQEWLVKRKAQELLAEPGVEGAPKISSLAVLPLRNLSPQGDQDYFADSMTEAITAELAKIKALNIRGRTSAMQYKDTDLGISEVAKALNVDALIEGAVQRENDDVRITVTLMHGATDTQLWTDSYTETITSVLKLQSDVALAIAEAVNTEITREERARIATTRTVDPRAHDAFMLGKHFLEVKTHDALTTAIRYFEDATRIDPGFAEAWAGLGEANREIWGWQFGTAEEFVPKARAAYDKALSVDENSPTAYAGLTNLMQGYDYEWQEAGTLFKKALDIVPNSARLHVDYALYLNRIGRSEEAVRHARTAREIDPRDPDVVREAAIVFSTQKDLREHAREILETLLESRPDLFPAVQMLMWANQALGNDAEAIATGERLLAVSDDTGTLLEFARLLGLVDETGRAERVLNEALKRENVDQASDMLAWAYVATGKLDEAFEAFERAYVVRAWELVYIRTLPYFESSLQEPSYQALRQDPRYWALINRLNFPPLPPDHPGYADELAWKARQVAEEMLREQGRLRPIEKIVVLPFDNYSGDPEQAFFVDAMTDALTAELGKIHALKVIARTSAMQYKDTDKSAGEIASELGVDALVEGSVFRADNNVRITAQLINGETEQHFWSENYEGELTDILKLQSDVTLAIADEIRVALSADERTRIAETSEVNPAAYDAFSRALHTMAGGGGTAADYVTALDALQEAQRLDPAWAKPYASEASLRFFMVPRGIGLAAENFAAAKIAAGNALERNPHEGTAHAVLGLLAMAQYQWPEAHSHFNHAIELAANDPFVHFDYGIFLQSLGRLDEAAHQADRIAQLGPNDPMHSRHAAHIYLVSYRHLDRAESLLTQVSEFTVPVAFDLGRLYELTGRYDEMVEVYEKLAAFRNNDAMSTALLAFAYALAGKESQARAHLERVLDLDTQQSGSRYAVGAAWLALGQIDNALDWFEQSADAQEGFITTIRNSPFLCDHGNWPALQNHPRYWALIERMQYPPLPHDHPGYVLEQERLVRKKAEELLQEQGWTRE